MKTRNHFGYWMTNQGYKIAAEIGVEKGHFSHKLLSTWNGNLVMIDTWEKMENYTDIANKNKENQEKCYEEAIKIAEFFNGRAKILRTTSLEASKMFPNEYFDVVYIDANHSYLSVMEDIGAWIGKIKNGGAIAGHDYIDGHINEGVFGVKSAVRDFFGKEPNIITNEPFPTWIIYK